MMKITLEPTTKVVRFNGQPARIWEGVTESGAAIVAFIPRIALHNAATAEEQAVFERELHEQRAPSAEAQSFPLSMVL